MEIKKAKMVSSEFKYPRDYPTKFIPLVKVKFFLKRIWRWLRVQRPITKILGFQYAPSTELIEIDLTYRCNLRCNNCNRSSAQAPDDVHIKLETIQKFVDQSLETSRQWKRIRILGGEPTLHPEFLEIIDTLLQVKKTLPEVKIEVVTNGLGKRVNKILSQLPTNVAVDNSSKKSNIQPMFGPFNLAPIDSWQYRLTDFANGCDIATSCGMGLTPQGYYPCAVAGGIDRVLGMKNGRQHLPNSDDDMRDLMAYACRLCGRFRDGHYIPEKLRKPILEQQTSASWEKIYSDWDKRRRNTYDEPSQ
ncbi:radical SAM protein [Shewanella xiamenensis]|uniref:radical SAM protein n=1 Tax=Shewanella xiamenensis TaxID=332186 RepID=UPI001DB4B24C|nr:radical SAM protein [Shewanella xiamenensis]MBW0295867.1 molybdenum cofactor biosynthesis family protein [Shewanella xiamenensis]MDH1316620.1 radical SAM protein [Shewanella xiamenensis]